jgi:NitT/TauT family transport system permease protein
MIAALDILQSIPVLSFLPPVMLAMIALFPDAAHRRGDGRDRADLYRRGVEHGVQLLLVDQEHSARAAEAADIYRFSRLQRLVQLELPYAAIGLVWNSIMSVAGGWFFLMACEMFHWARGLPLPGLGSYLQTAAGTGNGVAIAWGLTTMVAIIVAIDQLIWRPLIAWSDKFKFEQVESSQRVSSPLLHLLTHSNALRFLRLRHTTVPLNEAIYRRAGGAARERVAAAAPAQANETLARKVMGAVGAGSRGAGVL